MSKVAYISQILQKELEDGKYSPGIRFPAEGELSERFGVGTVTVNKAVGKLVDLGYLMRSGSRRDGTRVVKTKIFPHGLICFIAKLKSEFHNRILDGAIRGALSLGYAVVPVPGDNEESVGKYRRMIGEDRFSGMICTWGVELKTTLPIVYTDVTNLDHIPGLYHVRCDSRSGNILMGKWLLDSGRKNLVYYHSATDIISDVPRRQGFIDILRSAGVSSPENRIFSSSGSSIHNIRITFREMQKRIPTLDAIVCENDYDALYMRNVIKMDAPKSDILVTGFGNLQPVQLCSRFPTVEQHPEETGYRAAIRIIELIEHRDHEQPLIEELPIELINRLE